MVGPSPGSNAEITPDDRNRPSSTAFRNRTLAYLASKFGRELADPEHECLNLHRTICLPLHMDELVCNILCFMSLL